MYAKILCWASVRTPPLSPTSNVLQIVVSTLDGGVFTDHNIIVKESKFIDETHEINISFDIVFLGLYG